MMPLIFEGIECGREFKCRRKKLSWTGKEVLIGTKAISTFVMGCFDLIKDQCDQISAMMCRYRWNQKDRQHKLGEANQTEGGRTRVQRYTCFQPCYFSKKGRGWCRI
jgi:hypothetical protein